MEISVLLYDRFTALDCMGPYELLSRLLDRLAVHRAVLPHELRRLEQRPGDAVVVPVACFAER